MSVKMDSFCIPCACMPDETNSSERERIWGDALLVATRGLSLAVCIAATTLPLLTIKGIVEPLAGKATHVDLNMPITFIMSASIVFNVVQVVRAAIRKGAIEELRRQKDLLEAGTGLDVSPQEPTMKVQLET